VPGAVLLGQRRPRIRILPPAVDTAGHEALDILRDTGQEPDGWQCDAVCDILAEDEWGLWAARRTYMIAPRQNGKGGVIEPIELYAIFVLHEVVLHSAHLFDTARDAFMRIKGLIEGTPDLLKRVKSVMEAHGKEGIYLRPRPAVFAGDGTLLNPGGEGGELRFHARTKGGGRGRSPQRLVLDECFALIQAQLAALLPSISAQENPQVNAFSTPPPVGEPCEVLMDWRRKALDRRAAGLPAEVAWLEWGLPRDSDVTLPENWAKANPAYGIRISEKGCRDELDALGVDEFGVERCGIWPATGDEQWLVISQFDWDAANDPAERGRSRPAFVIEMSPDREWTAILAAWWRDDEPIRQIQILDLRPGVGWLPERVRELKRWRPCAWLIPRESPASSEVPWMERERIEVVRPGHPDMVAASGMFYDAIAGTLPDGEGRSPRNLRHAGQKLLDDAVAAAVKTPPEEKAKAWTWDPTRPYAFLLRGATAGLWGLAVHGKQHRPPASRPPVEQQAASWQTDRLDI